MIVVSRNRTRPSGHATQLRVGTLAFLVGVLWLHQCSVLPDAAYSEFLPIVLSLAYFQRGYRPVALVAAGFLWASWHAHLQMHDSLPAILVGDTLKITGRVSGLPDRSARGVRFEFTIASIEPAQADGQETKLTDSTVAAPRANHWAGKVVRLAWYREFEVPKPGEQWQFQVRLRRPHGARNPGGFDYEGWLFQRRIWATGYVRKHADNQFLADDGAQVIHAFRQRVGDSLAGLLNGIPHAALIKALAVGHRDAMSAEQWRVLRETGTAHLMAISGLHIGLVGGAAFLVGRFLWTRSLVLTCLLPAPTAAACAALTCACLYAAMAGFSLPTQRALMMLFVWVYADLCGLILAFLGNDGRKAATIFSFRYSSSR